MPQGDLEQAIQALPQAGVRYWERSLTERMRNQTWFPFWLPLFIEKIIQVQILVWSLQCLSAAPWDGTVWGPNGPGLRSPARLRTQPSSSYPAKFNTEAIMMAAGCLTHLHLIPKTKLWLTPHSHTPPVYRQSNQQRFLKWIHELSSCIHFRNTWIVLTWKPG